MKRILTCFALLSILIIPLHSFAFNTVNAEKSVKNTDRIHRPEVSEISGQVWFDTDADGIIDAGEYGIAGVPVFLFTCTGVFVQSAITDASGNYYFDELTDGAYKVFFNRAGLPSHYDFTFFDSQGTDNNALANGFTLCFDTDENEYLINAGFTILSSIGNLVWDDLNGNGLHDIGEPGISGVTVTLFNSSGVAMAQTYSNGVGSYTFNKVFPGFYYLVFDAGSEYTMTRYLGTNGTADSDISLLFGPGTTDIFEVVAGIDRSDLDAGYYKCAQICGFIYSDNNTNDLFDENENGINGLTIFLWQVTDEGPMLYATNVTGNQPGSPSADGFYTFCVEPGTYYVEMRLHPSVDLVLGLPFEGNDPEIYNHFDESNGPLTTYVLSASSGDVLCGLNGGLYCSGSFTNTIWLDEDFDGLRGDAEPPLQGVEVEVYSSAFLKVGSTSTDADGVFLLDSLRKGFYYLNFIKPEALEFTLPFADGGLISTIDCDVDNSFGVGTTPMYYLGGCETMTGLGAGFTSGVLPVKWLDLRIVQNEKNHLVEWSVASEHQSMRYDIMRSYNKGDHFEVIGSVRSSNSPAGDVYSFVDTQITRSGIYYYKIKHMNTDHSVSYSNTVSLIKSNSGAIVEVFPNPAHDYLIVNTSAYNADQQITLTMINASGQKVFYSSFVQSGDTQRLIDISGFQSGIFQLLITVDNSPPAMQKLIIAR